MRFLFGLFFRRIGNAFYKISNWISGRTFSELKIMPPSKSFALMTWLNDQGDKNHRLNYELKDSSLVFDLGGYKGEWASQIYCLYGSSVYIFEPYEKYFENINHIFRFNEKVRVFQFGLSKCNETVRLAVADNSSSTFLINDNMTDIKLVEASSFIDEYEIDYIDLMKINIEGGEYDLLEHLIESGAVRKIRNIQVQFHTFVSDAENRMRNIQNALCRTHKLTYQYEFVWENWRLID